MTEFKYCVHCENEPAVCFDTEVDAMKFARECTGTCSYVKVEKSEIDEDGEIWNTYHARPGTQAPRSSGIRRVHFDIDGEPVLDLTEENDVLKEFRKVEIEVEIQ